MHMQHIAHVMTYIAMLHCHILKNVRVGSARAHLHGWIAAATAIQQAARVWLLRRGLQQFSTQRKRCIAAVTRLQAIWRGRAERIQFLHMRQAAVKIQVALNN